MSKVKTQEEMGFGKVIPDLPMPVSFAAFYFRDYNFNTSLPHIHHAYEYMLVLYGEVSVAAEATLYPVPEGSIIIMPPGIVHCTILSSGTQLYERQILLLTPNYIAALLEKFKRTPLTLPSAPLVLECSVKDTIEFRELIENIIANNDKLKASDPFAKPIIDSLIALFFLKCSKKLAASPAQAVSNTSLVVGRLIHHIEEHFTEPKISLEELTAQTYISAGHLNRLFKAYTGVSLYKYVIQRRLILSTELLQQGFSVLDACLASGFEDYTCFLKAFKKTYGLTPRSYCKLKTHQASAAGILDENG